MRGVLIIILVAAIGVLGYLYWEDQQNSVSIKLEAPEITTN
jgi:lipopolysaccharide export system protein LptC